MVDLRITVDDLAGADVVEFLEAHVRQLREISPPGSSHALDLDGLRRPEITFWIARDGDGDEAAVVGCGALKRLDARHAELKSMRTDTARRRSGIASRLLEHILAEARERGFARMSLETGSTEFFAPARRLYGRFGFEPCAPFADYRPDPHSTFMTRAL